MVPSAIQKASSAPSERPSRWTPQARRSWQRCWPEETWTRRADCHTSSLFVRARSRWRLRRSCASPPSCSCRKGDSLRPRPCSMNGFRRRRTRLIRCSWRCDWRLRPHSASLSMPGWALWIRLWSKGLAIPAQWLKRCPVQRRRSFRWGWPTEPSNCWISEARCPGASWARFPSTGASQASVKRCWSSGNASPRREAIAAVASRRAKPCCCGHVVRRAGQPSKHS